MKTIRIASSIVLATLCSATLAQTPGKTRAEVKAETAAAIRSGDVAPPGEVAAPPRERTQQTNHKPLSKWKGKRAAKKRAQDNG